MHRGETYDASVGSGDYRSRDKRELILTILTRVAKMRGSMVRSKLESARGKKLARHIALIGIKL